MNQSMGLWARRALQPGKDAAVTELGKRLLFAPWDLIAGSFEIKRTSARVALKKIPAPTRRPNEGG